MTFCFSEMTYFQTSGTPYMGQSNSNMHSKSSRFYYLCSITWGYISIDSSYSLIINQLFSSPTLP